MEQMMGNALVLSKGAPAAYLRDGINASLTNGNPSYYDNPEGIENGEQPSIHQ
jgi:hypothetical protein